MVECFPAFSFGLALIIERSTMQRYIFFLLFLFTAGCSSVPREERPPAPVLELFPSSRRYGITQDTVTLNWRAYNTSKVIFRTNGVETDATNMQQLSTIVSDTSIVYFDLYKLDSSSYPKGYSFMLEKSDPDPAPMTKTLSVLLGKEPQIEERPAKDTSIYITGYTKYSPGVPYYVAINSIDLDEYPGKVDVYVSVADVYGNHIAGLAPPYNNQNSEFWQQLVETREGTKHRITDFEVIEYRRSDVPDNSSTFVMDYSGSMTGYVGALERAFLQATRSLKPKDDFSVIQFDNTIHETVKLGAKPNVLISDLMPMDSLGGGTAFYSACITGINSLRQTKKEKIAVLFTDGSDNASVIVDADDVIRTARASDTRIFVIAFIGNGIRSQNILHQIAIQTGGKSYFPTSASEIGPIFNEIYNISKVYYKITYRTVDAADTVRNIEIVINNNGDLDSANKDYYVKTVPLKEKRKVGLGWYRTGKHDLDLSKAPQIEMLIKYLKENPDREVDITAHADSRGDEAMNVQLTKQRALSFKSLLLKRGIRKSQIRNVEWKGEQDLLHNPDDTEWKQRENRRIEIEIVN